jgi:hypothetical protein
LRHAVCATAFRCSTTLFRSEPILDLPDEGLHVRIEDTVRVTADGAEVLTAAVPKQIDALLALVGTAD